MTMSKATRDDGRPCPGSDAGFTSIVDVDRSVQPAIMKDREEKGRRTLPCAAAGQAEPDPVIGTVPWW